MYPTRARIRCNSINHISRIVSWAPRKSVTAMVHPHLQISKMCAQLIQARPQIWILVELASIWWREITVERLIARIDQAWGRVQQPWLAKQADSSLISNPSESTQLARQLVGSPASLRWRTASLTKSPTHISNRPPSSPCSNPWLITSCIRAAIKHWIQANSMELCRTCKSRKWACTQALISLARTATLTRCSASSLFLRGHQLHKAERKPDHSQQQGIRCKYIVS